MNAPLALLVGFYKPEQRVAQLLFAFGLTNAMGFLRTGLISSVPYLSGYELVVFFIIASIGPPWNGVFGYHFFYRFPPDASEGRLWSFLKYVIYGMGIIWSLYDVVTSLRIFRNEQISKTFLFTPQFRTFFETYVLLFFLITIISIIGVILRNYLVVRDSDQRRRVRWAVFGSAIALIPVGSSLLIGLISRLFGFSHIQTTNTYTQFAKYINLLVIVPVFTIGYAILKHRVLDINVVVRRSLQYLLAKNALHMLLALPIIGVAYGIISKPDRPLRDLLFDHPYYPALIVLASLGLGFRRQIGRWLDRRFFREAYNQEQILVRLIDEVNDFNSMPELSQLVSRQIDKALHPEHISVFYRETEQRDLVIGYSSDETPKMSRIPSHSQLTRIMDGKTDAQEYPSIIFDKMLASDEQIWIEELDISLLVPISDADKSLGGLLLLGEKKSEQPYTMHDRHLLESVTRQMAMAFENIRLRDRVDKEAKIKRDVLQHLDQKRISLLRECPVCGECFNSTEKDCAKCKSELTLTLPVERTIDGKYRLERLLGRGGMGAVYHATDLRLDRSVAIKIMTGQSFGDPAAMRRFEREARASARLNHPNIVSVFDYGLLDMNGGFLVMEMVQGNTLRDELRQKGALPSPMIADWFDQLMEGVKTAHEAGVIHRDLKPENVLISKSNNRTQIKVLDFGLAKLKRLEASESDSLTAPGTVLGTLSYMSPEQLSGEDVDERSDIFSLGVMIVEALTGSRPFKGNSLTELLTAILQGQYQLIGNTQEILQLQGALQKCLAKDRRGRYETVAKMQNEIIPFIRICPSFSNTGGSVQQVEESNSSGEETVRL